jgi:hypothetical protein
MKTAVKNQQVNVDVKAYQTNNGVKFITDYPNDTPSDDNVSFEESFYLESNQSISATYEDINNGNYTEIEADDISIFGRTEEKGWLIENHQENI